MGMSEKNFNRRIEEALKNNPDNPFKAVYNAIKEEERKGENLVKGLKAECQKDLKTMPMFGISITIFNIAITVINIVINRLTKKVEKTSNMKAQAQETLSGLEKRSIEMTGSSEMTGSIEMAGSSEMTGSSDMTGLLFIVLVAVVLVARVVWVSDKCYKIKAFILEVIEAYEQDQKNKIQEIQKEA